MGKNIKSIYN